MTRRILLLPIVAALLALCGLVLGGCSECSIEPDFSFRDLRVGKALHHNEDWGPQDGWGCSVYEVSRIDVLRWIEKENRAPRQTKDREADDHRPTSDWVRGPLKEGALRKALGFVLDELQERQMLSPGIRKMALSQSTGLFFHFQELRYGTPTLNRPDDLHYAYIWVLDPNRHLLYFLALGK